MTHLRVVGALGILAWLGIGSIAAAQADSTPLTLRYDAPPDRWTQASPVSNGRLGAMVLAGSP